jgi:hypothetical protein
MLVSQGATSTVALVVLIAINAVANGSVIALSRDATRRRCEADARRAATRSRSRTTARGETGADQPTAPAARQAPGVDTSARRWPSRPAASWCQDVIDAEIVSEQKFLA